MTTQTAVGNELRPREFAAQPVHGLSNRELHDCVAAIRSRHASVGLALSVLEAGHHSFEGRGLADLASNTPITEDTVFRIGSITKVFTAIAVMQLVERGRIDLDRPADDYLHAYRLVLADPGIQTPTIRHLLTHTAGIPEVRSVTDLRHADFTPSGGRPAMPSVAAGDHVPALAEHYRDGLRVVVEPGTAFAYTNHGFATLGQIVEDVSGMPLDRYLREHVFVPLGMGDSDLVRSKRVASRLASGYVIARGGPHPVPDREWLGAGSGGIYSTPRDMARFAAAILGAGSNEHGRILEPATLATMFEPHYQPHPRIPGIGLGWFRGEVAGHRLVGHDGILPGFNSALLLAPDDGFGLIAFTNGSRGAFGWLQVELDRLMRQLLGVPGEAALPGATPDPRTWTDLSGRYVFQPRISDLRVRLMLRGGAEVFGRGGQLWVRLVTSVPGIHPELPLQPDDDQDPSVFRLDLGRYGIPPARVAFGRDANGRVTAVHTDLGGQPWSLVRVEPRTARRWRAIAAAALGAGAALVLLQRAGAKRDRGLRS
jgi:CubicO group peptidase (beta-lactamase class C family)